MAAKKVVKKKVVKPVKAIKNVKSKKKPEKLTYYYLDGTTSSKLDPKRILHREDGPALEWNDEYKEWHIKGNLIANKDKQQ